MTIVHVIIGTGPHKAIVVHNEGSARRYQLIAGKVTHAFGHRIHPQYFLALEEFNFVCLNNDLRTKTH